ncbi:efflux transporter outer membrane subunit [bacterium]|nr:efflux transporter outer membrane subunit [bacterium]
MTHLGRSRPTALRGANCGLRKNVAKPGREVLRPPAHFFDFTWVIVNVTSAPKLALARHGLRLRRVPGQPAHSNGENALNKRPTWPLAVVVPGIIFLGACSTKTRTVEPPLAIPATFSASGEAAPQERWWEAFEDGELNALMKEAMEGSFTLRSAWNRLEQADARRKAAGAPLLPTLDARAGSEYGWRQQRYADSRGGGPDIRSSRTQSVGLVAEYEVDLWGRVRSLRNAASLDREATAEDLRTAAITLSSGVATTWYQLQEQVGQRELLQSQIEISSETLRQIERRFDMGQAAATDVLQQRQLVEARREDRERVLAEIRSLGIDLAILLGRTPDKAQYGASGELIPLPPLPKEGVPSELIQSRPDVKSAFLAVRAADQRVASALADRYPRLSLVASYSTTSNTWRDLFDNWLASVAGNVAAPIFDAGARKAEVARQRALAAERLNDYGQAILEALGEVEDALNTEARQIEVVASIERQLALARQVQDRTLGQYLVGSEDYLRVLDSQLSVQGLERELLTARRDMILRRVDLCRALAGGWEMKPAAKPEPATKNDYPLPL